MECVCHVWLCYCRMTSWLMPVKQEMWWELCLFSTVELISTLWYWVCYSHTMWMLKYVMLLLNTKLNTCTCTCMYMYIILWSKTTSAFFLVICLYSVCKHVLWSCEPTYACVAQWHCTTYQWAIQYCLYSVASLVHTCTWLSYNTSSHWTQTSSTQPITPIRVSPSHQ